MSQSPEYLKISLLAESGTVAFSRVILNDLGRHTILPCARKEARLELNRELAKHPAAMGLTAQLRAAEEV